MFVCVEHVDEIDAARPLLERDEAVRQVWLEQRHRALTGRRWEPPKPLATGADAKLLHERALAWAASTPVVDRYVVEGSNPRRW